jgi:UDP-glucose 4-epimerase
LLAITGSTGFIGSYISTRLPQPQIRLIRKPDTEVNAGVQTIVGDLRSLDSYEPFLKDATSLIHLAWEGTPRTSFNPQESLLPTFNLFKQFAETHPSGHIIFTSSGGNIYGSSPNGAKFLESDSPNPLSSYSALKLDVENQLRILCAEYGMRATILRISNPYGTLLPGHRGQGLIGVAFAKLIKGEPLTIFDDLDSERDYLHLSDLSAAFHPILGTPPLEGECRLYNVSSGQGHSLREVLSLIEKCSNTRLHLEIAKEQQLSSSPRKSVLSYEKIHNELGWRPRISLAQGIHEMWESIKHLAQKKL